MLDINEVIAQVSEDPYPTCDRLRAMGRVLWVESGKRWLVTGHREAAAILRHENVSSDRGRWDFYVPPPGYDKPPGMGMFVMDPPDHTRLRMLVASAFTPRMVEAQRSRIAELVGRLLAVPTERGEIDLVKELAAPLPAILLADMLGIPADEQELFRDWTMTHIEAIDPVSHVLVSEEGMAARDKLEEYLADIIARRRRDPRDDLISGFIQAEEQGERLTAAELQEMCILLTVAGIETAGNLIGNGMYALLEHPDQLARLRAEPDLIGTAIEELLRYDAPIQLSGRVPTADIEIGGVTLRKNQMVGVMLGGANRDPEEFPDPHRLDLGRTPNNHLAFGRGIHFCLGAPLARVEGAIAIGTLVQRFPKIALAGAPERRQNVHVRGFVSLPLSLGSPA